MADLKISQLPEVQNLNPTEELAVVQGGVTSRINKNNLFQSISGFTGNTDMLDLNVQRTMFVRDGAVGYTGGGRVNLFTISGVDYYGSPNLGDDFLTGSTTYAAKNIQFRTVGKFGASGSEFLASMSIGGQSLTASTIAEVTGLTKANNHSFEIIGDILITNGNARVCYSLAFCDDKGNYDRYPLSDATVTQNITSFSGGPLELYIETGTTIGVTTYFTNISIIN